MTEYFNKKIVKMILGIGAKNFDVEFVHHPLLKVYYGELAIEEMYDQALLLRAYLHEDEGVTYP